MLVHSRTTPSGIRFGATANLLLMWAGSACARCQASVVGLQWQHWHITTARHSSITFVLVGMRWQTAACLALILLAFLGPQAAGRGPGSAGRERHPHWAPGPHHPRGAQPAGKHILLVLAVAQRCQTCRGAGAGVLHNLVLVIMW